MSGTMAAGQKGGAVAPMPGPHATPTGEDIYRLRGEISKLRCSTYQLEGDNIN